MAEILAQEMPEGCEWWVLSSKQQEQHGCRVDKLWLLAQEDGRRYAYRPSPLWLFKTCEQGAVEAYQLVAIWCPQWMLISDTKADRR